MHKLARFVSLAGVASLVVLTIGVAPAGAHHPEVSGVASCPGADHVIDWTIGNSQAITKMTITAADAVLNGTSYAVTGYVNPVAPKVPTHASTTIPGTLTGDVVISVTGHWPDGHVETRSATVTLEAPCLVETTTVPPTTAPPVTTVPPPHVTPTTAKHAVVPPVTGINGSSGGPQLAFTGPSDSTGWLLLAGLLLILAGFGAVCWLRFTETRARGRSLF